MRKIILLIILLFIVNLSYAATVQYGKITLTVENRPPVIKTLSMEPSEPYYDSVLSCPVTIDDENPSKTTVNYSWYVNGELKSNENSISNLKDNDSVKCSAIPIDQFGLIGKEKSAEAIILPSPASVKFLKPVLNSLGIRASAKELKDEMSISAITGMVTGKGGSSLTLVFMLAVFLMILIGLNAFAVIIAIRRKRLKYPRQDSASS